MILLKVLEIVINKSYYATALSVFLINTKVISHCMELFPASFMKEMAIEDSKINEYRELLK
jgi:hypothetical protein